MQNDSSYNVIATSISAFVKADSAHAFEVVAPFVKMESFRDGVRLAALDALRQLNDPRGVDYVLPYIKYGNAQPVRSAALNTLKMIGKGNAQAVTALIELLQDTNGGIRNTTIQILGTFADKRALTPLMELQQTATDEGTKTEVKKAIESIQKGL
jgi:HEAT repeat protein